MLKIVSLRDVAYMAIIVILCLFMYNGCNERKQLASNVDAMNDSLHISVNKLGQEKATTLLLVGGYETLLKSKDSTIRKLGAITNKHTIASTVINNHTTNEGTTKTQIVYDTLYLGVKERDTIFPTYKTAWKERWSEGTITATKDSISRSVTFYNEFNIVQSFEKESGLKGFFKPRVAKVSVTNLNPNTKTDALASYTKPLPKQHRWVYVVGGILAGIAITKF